MDSSWLFVNFSFLQYNMRQPNTTITARQDRGSKGYKEVIDDRRNILKL
jgi:hypothetical protein